MIIEKRSRWPGDKPGSHVAADVHTVGGNDDGVFAVWIDRSRGSCSSGKLIRIAAGDDGYWWEIDAFDSFWLPAIIKALKAVQKDVEK